MLPQTNKNKPKRAFPVLLWVFIASMALLLALGLYMLITGLSNPALTLPNPYNPPTFIL